MALLSHAFDDAGRPKAARLRDALDGGVTRGAGTRSRRSVSPTPAALALPIGVFRELSRLQKRKPHVYMELRAPDEFTPRQRRLHRDA